MGLKVTSQGVPSTSASDMELLESAVGFKEAFLWLARTDPIFKSITLKYKDWNKASALHECVAYEPLGNMKKAHSNLKPICSMFGDANSSTSHNMLDNLGRPCSSLHIVDDNEFGRFPVLAMMACDFLAVSISTPHKCSFVEVKKLVDSEHLDSDIMEAFICTESWLEKP
ncbi:hypothetical protein JRO89_XS03G0077600 [Xanthoceras sorbifolium]|uniref:Uncharacterized protein n=1 Tax=Xanthoceras sorbifolium TaxID=99658 RepID=A0ABQ8I9P5_9ROSI|nr:hypothetical protein JRO89_XS03G0077600 [Xanthoceras sorbifolium]